MPGAEIELGEIEALCQVAIEISLHCRERLARRRVHVVERVKQSVGIELVEQQLGLPEIRKADGTCGLIAQTCQLPEIVRDDRADLFAGLPCRLHPFGVA